MADKTSFTKDEWTLLLKSPMIAGMAITAADPSGLWGLLKESFAGGAALTKVAADPNANALIKACRRRFLDQRGAERGARRPQGGIHRQQAGGHQEQINRVIAPGLDSADCKGTWRRSRLQGLAAPDQSKHSRSRHRGRQLVWRRRASERRRKSDPRRDIECARCLS